MKKTTVFILILFSLLIYSDNCYGQLLKKISKGIENASKKLDEVLGTEDSSGTNETSVENDGSKITVSTPHKNLQVNLTNAEMEGENFIIEFTITNKGDNINDFRLKRAAGGGADSQVYDNLGNPCHAEIMIGSVQTSLGRDASTKLLTDTPVKVKVVIYRVSPQATSFTQVRINAKSWDYGATYAPSGDFVFKNVPITRNEAQEVILSGGNSNTTISGTPAIQVSMNDIQPCDGSAFTLTIKGGTPFLSTTEPFKIKITHKTGDRENHAHIGKFVKKTDGSYTVEIFQSGGYDEEYILELEDANGNKKKINFMSVYCA